MPFHRGDHPGAVAVSYSTNMAPLSPSRRYSSSSSTSTSGIGSTSTTTKFNTYRSPSGTIERTSFTTTSSNYRLPPRRIHCSPARSVSSYGDISSVYTSGLSLPKYSSTSTSSASSTVSSASSNRDRNGLTPTSNLSAEEFYQKYSAKNYEPNIHRSINNGTTSNGHSRSLYSTPSSLLNELHGGDERDSINRERRDRSFSSDTSNVSDRWSTRQSSKRRSTPTNSITGHAQNDEANEVTTQQPIHHQQQNNLPDVEKTNNLDHLLSDDDDDDDDNNVNNNDHNTPCSVNTLTNGIDNLNNHQTLNETERQNSLSSIPSSQLSSPTTDTQITIPISISTSSTTIICPVTINNIAVVEHNPAWDSPTNNVNSELLTNNNAQECDLRLSDLDATSVGGREGCKWTIANGVEGDCDVEREENERSSEEILGGTVPNESIAQANSFHRHNEENQVDSYGILDENSLRVTRRPTNNGEDPAKPSTSRRTTLFGWNGTSNDDFSASTAANTSATPVGVHQAIYRGLSDPIEESSTTRPARSRILGRRDDNYGLNGLRNIGNTCFMNSVIQCLSNTRPLLEYLLNEQYMNDINGTTSSMKGALIKAFAQVIHELWEGSGERVVNTTALKTQIQKFAPRFMGYAQQDAQEFLRYLLEGLHEDVNRVTVKPQPILTDIPDHYSDSHKAAEGWKRYLRSEDSTIVDDFVGQLRSSLHCTSCDHVSVTLDPFWDLSLPIPSRSGTVKLNQCLEHFTKVETLDGDEKPTCSKCQVRRKCTKRFCIQKFPKILVIHLKRFSPTERFRSKLSVLVDFPLMGLDLSAFAAPGVQGCTYNLYGIANHSGTPYSGHYTAYCKHPYSGEWHEYNDSRVSTVSASSVISSEAYVLFYEQQQESSSPHL